MSYILGLPFRLGSGNRACTLLQSTMLKSNLPSKCWTRGLSYHGKTHTLNTGAVIPAIGFGTFQDKDQQEGAVLQALKTGYRHIDTARVYDTEKPIGTAIQRSNVPREDIFLTTKLWCNSYYPEDVETALEESLADLKTDYVDLFLMHYLCTFQRGQERFPKGTDGRIIAGETDYLDTWKAMERLIERGRVKAIGVSNFSKGEVERLIEEGNIVPAVHQMELHPYLQQNGFVEWQKSQGIHMVQFSPLANQNSFYREVDWSNGRANRSRLIDEEVLIKIGRRHGKSSAQVALAWGVAKGRSVIPKSVIDWQIKENLESDFELDSDDMSKIAALDKALRFNDPSSAYEWNLYSDLEGKA